MRLLKSSKEIGSRFLELLENCETVSFAVAWASIDFEAYEQLCKQSEKIKLAVVGTHFHQTHPEFIRSFRKHSRTRFLLNSDELFHPKAFLFEGPGSRTSAIIGSANFTAGGFERNHELAIEFDYRDTDAAATFRSLANSFETYWNSAEAISIELLENYERQWLRRQPVLNRIAGRYGGSSNNPTKPIEKDPVQSLSWSEYVRKVRVDPEQSVVQRLSVLDAARKLFETYIHFKDMPPDQRRGIAGIQETEVVRWKWFGSMVGSGRFKHLVIESPMLLSDALDEIPFSGRIGREQFDAFCGKFRKALEAAGYSSGGVATPTRLLAMKRPDYFVCFDSANKSNLCASFGIPQARVSDLNGYWDQVVERVIDSEWWDSARPLTEEDAKIWDGRAAFLDAMYYVPK